MTAGYGPIENCQVCDSSDLRSVLFLGYLPPVNTMRPVGSLLDQEDSFPAEMKYCRNCHLVQLAYAVDPNVLFPPEYPYTSGTTKILRDNFANLATEVRGRYRLGADDLVVDIGSNDGTLLNSFAVHGQRVFGIEPSLTAQLAIERGIPTRMSFFDAPAVDHVITHVGSPRVVTATNVFAHIHRVHEVMVNVSRLVGSEGLFITESHYLYDLIETLQYDTIYHEHLRYYSLTSLKFLLEHHGFRVVHVQRIPTHGGSIRVFATKAQAIAVDRSVEDVLAMEARAGLTSESWIEDFRTRVVKSKLGLYQLLRETGARGEDVYGVGAPSRASTLINYVGLDEALVACVLEVGTSKKLHKYIPGTTIPVVTEDRLTSKPPRFLLLLSWHIAAELCANLTRKGYQGDFIIPLPEPRLITAREAQELAARH